MTYYAFHVIGPCPILYSTAQTFPKRASDVRSACVESCGLLTRVRPGQHTSGVTAVQVVGWEGENVPVAQASYRHGSVFVPQYINFTRVRKNGEKRLLASIVTVCLSVSLYARNSAPHWTDFS